MDSDPPVLFEIWDVNDDCEKKLRDTVAAIQAGNREFHDINWLVNECAEEEPTLALEVIDELVEGDHILASQIREALLAISKADASLAGKFFDQAVDNPDYEQEYLADYVPYLFWDDIDQLCTHVENWYSSSPHFFELAVEQTLDRYHEERLTHVELDDRDEKLLSTLKRIAGSEGLNLSSAEKADVNDTLIEASLILDDLRHLPSNLDSYDIGVDYTKISANAGDYPNLISLLGPKWENRIKAAGAYQLPRLLSHDIPRSEFHRYIREADPDTMVLGKERFDIASVAKLSYLDHCCESIDVDSEPTKSIRDGLLDREKYGDALAELDTINALRREFVDKTVDIEPPVAGRHPDLGIELDRRSVWVEVTNARETTEKRLQDVFSAPSGVRSRVRKKITDKTRGQVSDIKQARPGDLTMIVLKNEFSAIDDHLVQEYAVGNTQFVMERDAEDPDIYAVPGEPVAKEDDYSGNPEDEGIENLDILVNFKYTSDAISKPYMTGQVFSFSKEADDQLLYRLGEAFNAGDSVFKTPFASK